MFFLTQGNYRFMKLLLARRGNWMQKDLEDMTPLHLTTRHKSPKCLALLLKHMAPGEVDTQDKNKVKMLLKDNTCKALEIMKQFEWKIIAVLYQNFSDYVK